MALSFKLQKNHLQEESGYYPLIINQTVMSFEEVLEEIQNNTTLRSADARLAIERLSIVMAKALADGKKVRTPFGIFRLGLKGSLASQEEDYRPGAEGNDHEIVMHFRSKSQFLDQLTDQVELHRNNSYTARHPAIFEIQNLSGDEEQYRSGDIIAISGQNLKCDCQKQDEGVFWTNEEGNAERSSLLIDNTTSMLKLQIPQLPTGDYQLSVTSRLGNHHLRSSFEKPKLHIEE